MAANGQFLYQDFLFSDLRGSEFLGGGCILATSPLGNKILTLDQGLGIKKQQVLVENLAADATFASPRPAARPPGAPLGC